MVAAITGHEGIASDIQRDCLVNAFVGIGLRAVSRPREIGSQRFQDIDVLKKVRPLNERKPEPRAKCPGKGPFVTAWVIGEHGEANRVDLRLGKARGDDRGIETAGHAQKQSALRRSPCVHAMLNDASKPLRRHLPRFLRCRDMVPRRPA